MLRSIIVDYLERSFELDNVAVAYIYCSYKERENQTAVNLIGNLVLQLAQRHTVLSDEITSLYHRHIKKQTRPTINELSGLLQSEINRFLRVFVVIDALDECPQGKDARDIFLSEVQKLQPGIHLLVTSRHDTQIEREFGNAARLEIRANDSDVRKYLKGRIASMSQLVRHVKKDPTLQDIIINTLAEKAEGMYVLIRP